MERYIKEYANAKIKRIKSNILMQKPLKETAINQINNALKIRERGLITIDETIKVILEA